MKAGRRAREAEEQLIKFLLRHGREVSIAPSGNGLCWPCMWIGVFCAAFSFPLFMEMGMGPWILKGPLGVFVAVCAVLQFLLASGEYGNPITRVVLADGNLLFKPSRKYVFERLEFRHMRRVSVRRMGPRGTILCIRVDYKKPGERDNHFEFVPAAQYRFDAQDGNPLCDEIAGLMAEAPGSAHVDGAGASAVDRSATV